MAQLLAKHRRATTFHSVKKERSVLSGVPVATGGRLILRFSSEGFFRGAGWLAGLASGSGWRHGVGAGVADRDEGQYRPRSHVFALGLPHGSWLHLGSL
jgi:hypothetical protein